MKNKLNIEKINQKCQELGFTQTKLSKELDVTREAVSQWLKGEKFPRPDKLLRLAQVLKLNFSELVKKVSLENEPVVAFRKKGAHKITPEYIEQAKDMGRILKHLVPHLPFDNLSQPASLIRPLTDYPYIQKVVNKVRNEINVQEGDAIDFSHLIKFFNELHAVLIPVLWGSKDKHENALHIYLPESMTTWIYLNLDCKIHDFKFWMAHELGHVYAPDLKDDEGEEFADSFAGAFLFPEKLAEREYIQLRRLTNIGCMINHIKGIAEKLVVSPLTVYYEINKYANYSNKPVIDLESNKEIFKANINFNKQFKTLSEVVFGSKSPSPAKYIACAKEEFGSPFFDSLKTYIEDNRKSASFVQNILNISILDAQNIYEEL